MPPSLAQIELTQWVKTLSADDLALLFAVVSLEMDQRTGREKYRFPDHVQRLMN